MRPILILFVLLMFSAPMVARENLTRDEVERFLETAEDAGALGEVETVGAPRLLGLKAEEALLARHGFTEATWHRTATRILAAHQALLLVLPRDGGQLEKKLNQDRSLSGEERRTLSRLLSEQRKDMQDLAAETRADQAVVAPFRNRLDEVLYR